MHLSDLRDPMFRVVARDPDAVYREALRQGSSMEDLRAEAGRIRDRELQNLNYGVAISPHTGSRRSVSYKALVADGKPAEGKSEARDHPHVSGASGRGVGGGVGDPLVGSGSGSASSSVGQREGRGREEDEDEEIDPEDFRRWLEANKAVDGGAVQLSDEEAAWEGKHGENYEKRSW